MVYDKQQHSTYTVMFLHALMVCMLVDVREDASIYQRLQAIQPPYRDAPSRNPTSVQHFLLQLPIDMPFGSDIFHHM